MKLRVAAAGMAAGLGALAAGGAWAAGSRAQKGGQTEGLFLDLSKVHLGTISSEEDKRKYLYTIQLEKARITRRTLKAVYENAHDLYRSGDFESSRDLTGKILNIDPGYEDAAILQRAAGDLQGSRLGLLSERRLVQGRFDEGIALYRQGRLVEASEKLDETVKLSPSNLKARYWLRKVRGEMAEEHFRRGQNAYRQHRLREALDQWYSALVLNPRYPRLVGAISKVEAELRQAEANEKLQKALQLYSEGKSEESLKSLDQVLQVEPGDPKAQRLMSEIRSEIANQHVGEGRRLYQIRQYNKAIAEWKKATEFGYDERAANKLVAAAKDQMRREAESKRKAEELARQREEDEARRREEAAAAAAEAERKRQEEAQKQLTAQPPTLPTPQPTGPTEEDRRAAIVHWNQGMVHFMRGELDRARESWLQCKNRDPGNSDCVTGLQRIENQLGGP